MPGLWQTTVVPLTRMAASTDPVEQLAGMKALACVPADVSPAAEALIDALDRDDDQRQAGIAGLTHAAQSDCGRVVDVFAARLKVRGARRRTTAAEDISLAAVAVWSASPIDPNANMYGERLTTYEPRPSPTDVTTKSAAISLARDRFLTMLVASLGDPARGVREAGVNALLQIRQYDLRRRGQIPFVVQNGKMTPLRDDRLEKSKDALDKARQIVAATDPDLAKKISDQLGALETSVF